MAMEATYLPRTELLQVADVLAREKGIDREEVLVAIEQAVQNAGRAKYGQDFDIRATIHRQTGEISLFRYVTVVDEVEDENVHVTVEEANSREPGQSWQAGDFIIEELPPVEFGRIAARAAKQVISHRVHQAEREREYREYKDKVGEIVNGMVKSSEYSGVKVDLTRAEAIIRREDLLPRESFRNNDRIRAYIVDVREEVKGPQIFLSRTHPEFMRRLFRQEVPEIYEGIIEIKAVARDPGSRAKIGVLSHDSSIDPVGACVGMRGSRVQAVVGELQGEKIDIVPWSDDPATFVVNALAPAEVSKVVLDEEEKRIEVVTPDDQLSLAIGRKGQNVRLASILTGWSIDILTEAEESERRQEEFRTHSRIFMEALDIDDVIAHLLVAEGFNDVVEIAEADLEELIDIEGFDEDIAAELQDRARAHTEMVRAELDERRIGLGVSDELAAVEGLTLEMVVALGEQEIRTIDDLGDLASDELIELLPDMPLDRETADSIIMRARAHWFPSDPPEDPDGTE